MLVILYTEQATHSFGTTSDLNLLVDSHKHKVGSIAINNKEMDFDSKAESIVVDISFNDVKGEDIKSMVIVQSLSYTINVSRFNCCKLLINIIMLGQSPRGVQAAGRKHLPDPRWHSRV